MGMNAGFGQTGVGAATTQSSNMPAPTGGKGGGTAGPLVNAATNVMSDVGQRAIQNAQPYQPMGGNVYGYNMQRLARQMDPSARLPQQQQIYTQPGFVDYGYNAPSYGGKGGGMGGYGMQAPQFFGYNPFVAPMVQATAQPVMPTPTPAVAPAPAYDDAALRQQITELQNQIRGLTPTTTPTPRPYTSTAAPATVAGLYQQYLGRAPENADVAQYWNQRFGQTIDPDEVAEFVRAANIERAQTGRQPVPGFDVGEIDFGIAERRPVGGASATSPANPPAPAPEPASASSTPNTGYNPYQGIIPAPAPAPAPTPAPTPAPIPAPAPSSVASLYQQFLGRAPESEGSAQYWQQRFGSEISPQEVEQFKVEANKERVARGLAPMKKGGAVKKTKVQHKGMSNNLKKMVGK